MFTRCRPFWLSLFFFAGFLACALPCRAQINWAPTPSAAVEAARQSQKKLFVYMYSPNAEDCRRFERETLTDASITSILNTNYVPLGVNVLQQRIIADRFGVFRVPTILLLDPSGTEYMRLITYYPADKLAPVLGQAKEATDASAAAAARQSRQGNTNGVLFYESFDGLYGWGNVGSAPGCVLNLTLVQGVRGNAFKLNYELETTEHNWVEVNRELEPQERFKLPAQFTIVLQMAGEGAHNHLTFKMLDEDGTNWGFIMATPRGFKGKQYVYTSDNVGYLWGGADKELGQVKTIQVAVSPNHEYWKANGAEPKGMVFIDELYILPGVRTDIAGANPWE